MRKSFVGKSLLTGMLCLVMAVAVTACSSNGSAPNAAAGTTAGGTQSENTAKATDFPNKPITIVVGNSAGGGTDLTARVAAEYMPKYLNNVSVIVSNNPTGSGEAAWLEVANSDPDGYTLGIFNSGQIMSTVLRDTKYQVENYKYISQLTDDYRCLVIRADDDRFNDYDSFIEYAKEHPGDLLVGDSGAASAEYFVTMAVNHYAGVELTSVHSNGSSETRANLLGKHLDAISCAASEVISLINDGSAKIIIIGNLDGRLEAYPDVPTFMEKGVNMHIPGIRGFYCPKDTPQEVIDILVEGMKKVTEDPEYIKAMEDISQPVVTCFGTDCDETVFAAKASYQELMDTLGLEKQK